MKPLAAKIVATLPAAYRAMQAGWHCFSEPADTAQQLVQLAEPDTRGGWFANQL